MAPTENSTYVPGSDSETCSEVEIITRKPAAEHLKANPSSCRGGSLEIGSASSKRVREEEEVEPPSSPKKRKVMAPGSDSETCSEIETVTRKPLAQKPAAKNLKINPSSGKGGSFETGAASRKRSRATDEIEPSSAPKKSRTIDPAPPANPRKRVGTVELPGSSSHSKRRKVMDPHTCDKKGPEEAKAARSNASSRSRKVKKAKPVHVDPRNTMFEGKTFYIYSPLSPVGEDTRLDWVVKGGGEWAREWGDGSKVTHLVLDDSYPWDMTYEAVTKGLKVQSIPSNIVVVGRWYVRDSWFAKKLLPPTDHNYKVKGWKYEQHIVGGKELKPTNKEPEPAKKEPQPANKESGTAKKDHEFSKEFAKFLRHNIPRTQQARDAALLDKIRGTRDFTKDRSKDELDELLAEVQGAEGTVVAAHNFHLPTDIFQLLPDESEDEFGEHQPDVAEFNGFCCKEKNDGASVENNPNARAIELFRFLALIYESMGGDYTYRAYAFRGAANTLSKESEYITTKEQAKQFHGIGKSISDCIVEIAQTDRLRRLANLEADKVESARRVFLGIFGVGDKTAATLIAKQWYSLVELRDAVRRGSVKLNRNQQIGLELYEDFQERIPRGEIRLHEDLVTEVARTISPDLQVTIGGSYRRGQESSGDIDFLFTALNMSKDTLSRLVLTDLIDKLSDQGYLTHKLTSYNDEQRDRHSRSLGVSRLPGTEMTHRRVDFVVIPWEEWGAGLIRWTGNTRFNRSLSLLAKRKGCKLSDHGLFKGGIRGTDGHSITDGVLVEAQDEKKIFDALGVMYRPPEHRIC